MKSQQEQFLNLRTHPARMKAEEAAWYLGFAPNEITVLMTEGLLKPLGHPPQTGVKYFATGSLADLRKDEKWLARASDCIVQYWRGRNDKKTAHPGENEAAPLAGQSNRRDRRVTEAVGETAKGAVMVHCNARS